MSSTMIVKLMTNLIEKKFYDTKDEAIQKLDVYFAMNRISEEEYAELVLLAESMYEPPVVEEETTEGIVEETETVEE